MSGNGRVIVGCSHGEEGPDQVIVYFYQKNHVSQVYAYYNGSAPASAVSEYSGSSQQGGNQGN